jgi:hypothetical protein
MWLRSGLRLRVELLRRRLQRRLLQAEVLQAEVLEEGLPHSHQASEELLRLLQDRLQSLRNEGEVPSRAFPLQTLLR